MHDLTVAYSINLQYFAGEKTEKATPKRRQEAREKGQVAKSQEVSAAAVMLGCFTFLYFMGQTMGLNLMNILKGSFTQYLFWDVTANNIDSLFKQLSLQAAMIVAPVLLVAWVTAVLANYIQVGFLFTMEPLKMKLEKLSPLEGAKRMFSLRSVVELLKSILKIILTSTVAVTILWGARNDLVLLSGKTVQNVLSLVASLTAQIGIFVALLFFVLAVLDYAYQRYEFEKSLRMSKQDIKDEAKKSEGDPLIKGKIRQRQREMAMRRMMQDVPKADVVITNPTHFAVAIQYDAATMRAPKVIAKGKDHIALKIKEIARAENVVTMENKPLARALFAQVEIDQEIPDSLFKAVAEVLAYVYKLKRKI